MSTIPINIIFEDILSEAVLRKILSNVHRKYMIGSAYNAKGNAWIKQRITGLNNAAQGMPYLVLIDLDQEECAPILLGSMLGVRRHSNLLLRVAVREVESWLMSCPESFASYAGIRKELIPPQVETIVNPKEFLIQLFYKSRKRELRDAIVPRAGSTARIGPDYNGRLIEYVKMLWDPKEARKYSPSLDRTIIALERFEPIMLNNQQ